MYTLENTRKYTQIFTKVALSSKSHTEQLTTHSKLRHWFYLILSGVFYFFFFHSNSLALLLPLFEFISANRFDISIVGIWTQSNTEFELHVSIYTHTHTPNKRKWERLYFFISISIFRYNWPLNQIKARIHLLY